MEENNEVEFKDVKRKIIFANGGAIIGFFIVKAFVFNGIEDLGWHLFWEAVFSGNLTFDGAIKIVTTSGFIKLAVGTVVGFKIGEWIENGTFKNFIESMNDDSTDNENKNKEEK
jgi:hypothetical protein